MGIGEAIIGGALLSGVNALSQHKAARSAGSATDANKIIDAKSIGAHETYTCPEMIGKYIPSGYFIQALASEDADVTIDVNGIEIT